MPATKRRRWTAREVRDLIAANPLHSPRYELVDGELLVTPSPGAPHQGAVALLMRALDAYLRSNSIGVVTTSPFDVEVEVESVLQPDVFVVPIEEWRRLMRGEMPCRELLLAIEIVSPSSSRYDRVTKRRLYQRAGTPEYWVVDLDARVVEHWRPEDIRPEIIDGALTWRPAGSSKPMMLHLPTFFTELFGA